ncbi:hypothetical protein BB561_002405 [Smittium simulii]|uniref:ATP-dependent RNA helicase n=1 Tax=Smittium simulii TaxID=133385 RepID=A0A2T9YQI3_9FUNG|nr:hypothetical protein BB561_002405 [Smittium simulii]
MVLSLLPFNQNLVIKSKTGTGKTLAYLVAAFDFLMRVYIVDPSRAIKRHNLGILVVVPTQELSKQVFDIAQKIFSEYKLDVILLKGGMSYGLKSQMVLKNRHDIVIGTPQSILYFSAQNLFFGTSIKSTSMLILDEADKLLKSENLIAISEIIKKCPKNIRTILTSATVDKKTMDIFGRNFYDYKYKLIESTENTNMIIVDAIKQSYIKSAWDIQLPLLYHVILTRIAQANAKNNMGCKIIIFLPTVSSSSLFANVFEVLLGSKDNIYPKYSSAGQSNSINIFHLTGRVEQAQRTDLSIKFKTYDCSENRSAILFTTDVTSRGIDYPNVDLVLQIGLPFNNTQYVHRVGRSGRAGAKGESIIFLSDSDKAIIKILKESYDLDLKINQEFRNDVTVSLRHALKKAENEIEMLRNGYYDKDNLIANTGNTDLNNMTILMQKYANKMEIVKNITPLHDLRSSLSSLLNFYKLVSKYYEIDNDRNNLSVISLVKLFDKGIKKPNIAT